MASLTSLKRAFVALGVVAGIVLVAPAYAARPVLALFEMLPAEGTDRSIADDGGRYLATYLRENGKVEVFQVRPDIAPLRRGIAEGRLTESDLSNMADPTVRRKVASEIGADYSLSGQISLAAGKVVLAVELADSKAGKVWKTSTQAESSGTDVATGLTNALRSTTNTVVEKLSMEVFAALPQVVEKPAAERLTDPTAVTDADTARRIERANNFMLSGNTAAAINELRRGVNNDPRNPTLRILLAKAYAKRGLYDNATRELNEATRMAPDSDAVLQATAELYETTGSSQDTITFYEGQIAKKPDNVKLRVSLGDLLWKKARVDDAIKRYEEAAALDPKNVNIQDRLVRCYAAKSQFKESLKHLEIIAKLEPTPDPAKVAERYSALMVVVEAEVKSISTQFDQGAKTYEDQEQTREQYYNLVKSLTLRSDTLAQYLDKVTAPQPLSSAHSHRTLAVSLLSQAGTSMMSFLESNSSEQQNEATLYLSEAKKELSLAALPPAPKISPTPAPTTALPPTPNTSG